MLPPPSDLGLSGKLGKLRKSHRGRNVSAVFQARYDIPRRDSTSAILEARRSASALDAIVNNLEHTFKMEPKHFDIPSVQRDNVY